MILYGQFGLGFALALVGWIGFGLVRSDALRAVLRAAAVALCATPSVLVGHGLGLAPALFICTVQGHLPLGLVPIAAVGVALCTIQLRSPSLRRSRTAWPLDLRRLFLEPLAFKLLLGGAVLVLLLLGLGVTQSPPVQVAGLVAGVGANYALCGAARPTRAALLVPVLFPLPGLLCGLGPIAVPWTVAGLAGLFAARKERVRLLGLGLAVAVGCLLLSLVEVVDARSRGDLYFAWTFATLSLGAGIVFALLIRRARRAPPRA